MLCRPKMKILSLIIHLHVIANPQDFFSIFKTQMKFFWWNLRAFCPSIDSCATDTLTLQKVLKELVKLIHMNWAVWSKFYEEILNLKRLKRSLCDEQIAFRLLFTYKHWSVNINRGLTEPAWWARTNLLRESPSLVLAEAQTCCITHKIEPHWFSHIKRTCFSFHLPWPMCDLMNVLD